MVSMRLQVGLAKMQRVRSDRLPHEMIGRVPIWVVRDVIHHTRDWRRWQFLGASDHLHRIDGLAVLVKCQHGRAGIDQQETGLRR